jgi:hypothetical protein
VGGYSTAINGCGLWKKMSSINYITTVLRWSRIFGPSLP